MTVLATLAALAVSLAAIGYLAATDPKRRRAFDRAPLTKPRHPVLAVALVLLPGVLLLADGNGAGFVAWLGAATVAGWALAALSPDQARQAQTWLIGAAGRARRTVGRGVAFVGRAARAVTAFAELCQAPERITILEQRVAELEAELAGRANATYGNSRCSERRLAEALAGPPQRGAS